MVAAGVIPVRKKDKLQVLLGHCGGPYWSNRDEWGIIKGQIEEGENPINAAIREFKEETGITLSEDELVFLGLFEQNKSKQVHAFGLEKNLDENKMVSNETEIEYKGQMIKIPEIDKYQWMDIDVAENKIFDGQRKILEYIKINYCE